MKNRTVLYARFSPRPNSAECESAEKQLERMDKYATERGWPIIARYAEKAVSGGAGMRKGQQAFDLDRPGLFRALDTVPRHGILLACSVDRLARNAYVWHTIESEVSRRGARIELIEGGTADSAEQRMLLGILAIVAEYQRELIRARTRHGFARRRAAGLRSSAIPRWGVRWHSEPGKPTVARPASEEIEIIALVARIMQRPGFHTYYRICKVLRALGVRNPRTGRPISPESVRCAMRAVDSAIPRPEHLDYVLSLSNGELDAAVANAHTQRVYA